MKAAFFSLRDLQFEIRDVEPPAIVDGETLLRVEACGICGTDLHEYRRKFETPRWKMLASSLAQRVGITRLYGPTELRPGHEICGTVEESSSPELNNHKVVVLPNIPCGTCWACQHGLGETVCQHFNNIGFERAGGFAEYVSVPQKNILEISKKLDSSIATLAEPVACGLHAIEIARLKERDNILVLGVGPIGLLITFVCSTEYASNIVACDPSSFRLKVARELGAMDTIEPEDLKSQDMFPDIVFDCVGGLSQTTNQIIDVIRPRGTICIMSFYSGAKPVNFRRLQSKEAQIKNIQACSFKNLQDAVSIIERYATKLQCSITHTFSLEKISEAFSAAIKHEQNNAVKVVIKP